MDLSNRRLKSAHSMIALAFALISTTLDPGGVDAVRLTEQASGPGLDGEAAVQREHPRTLRRAARESSARGVHIVLDDEFDIVDADFSLESPGSLPQRELQRVGASDRANLGEVEFHPHPGEGIVPSRTPPAGLRGEGDPVEADLEAVRGNEVGDVGACRGACE